jgi:DNA repair protein RecO (recombination protein O)
MEALPKKQNLFLRINQYVLPCLPMILATKAIVLKTIKYGETSLIVTLYTAQFGIQSCIVQGVRKSTKKVPAKSNYFFVGNILQVALYYQANKKLQRIRDFQFEKAQINISNSIVKNAIVMMMMEVVHHTLQEPEPNTELFDWITEQINHVENTAEALLTWMPHYFCIQYAAILGFGIHGNYSETTPILHLQDGVFIPPTTDVNAYYCLPPQSKIIDVLNMQTEKTLHTIVVYNTNKRKVLQDIITYFQLHIAHMQTIKSIEVLAAVFA